MDDLDFLLQEPNPSTPKRKFDIGDLVKINTPRGMKMGIVMEPPEPLGNDYLVREISSQPPVVYWKSELDRWNK